ncbi:MULTISPECIES: hypothetical protein [Ralstonia]|nr:MULTISPECIES: hypothetical protein [Ralstonia]MCM3583021.1 hypothetical protein [Ralstonia pickettii]MDR9387244.1 hypothetical protein [Ralstonia sp. 11b]MEA3269473.1 hypothetical protein [Pseudomonadota bacterium]
MRLLVDLVELHQPCFAALQFASTRMKVDEPCAYFVKIKLEGYANF